MYSIKPWVLGWNPIALTHPHQSLFMALMTLSISHAASYSCWEAGRGGWQLCMRCDNIDSHSLLKRFQVASDRLEVWSRCRVVVPALLNRVGDELGHAAERRQLGPERLLPAVLVVHAVDDFCHHATKTKTSSKSVHFIEKQTVENKNTSRAVHTIGTHRIKIRHSSYNVTTWSWLRQWNQYLYRKVQLFN